MCPFDEVTPLGESGRMVPWHTEADVQHAMEEIRNHLARLAGPFNGYDRRARDIRDALLRVGGEELLADLARVALGMKPYYVRRRGR